MIYSLKTKDGVEVTVNHCCFGALRNLDELDKIWWKGDYYYDHLGRDDDTAWEDVERGKVCLGFDNLDSFTWYPNYLPDALLKDQLSDVLKGHPFFSQFTLLDNEEVGDVGIHSDFSKGSGATMLPLFILRNVIEYKEHSDVCKRLLKEGYPLIFSVLVASNIRTRHGMRGVKFCLLESWDDSQTFDVDIHMGHYLQFLRGGDYDHTRDYPWGDSGYEDGMVESLTCLPSKSDWSGYERKALNQVFSTEGQSKEDFLETVKEVWSHV